MRIGINTLFLIPGEVGGSQTYFCETLRAMMAGFPDDEYVLFTQRENDAFLKKIFGEGKALRYVKLDFSATNRYVRIIREQAELPSRVKREKIDVLWSPGYTCPVFCRTPQVVTIHDMQYKRYPEDLSWPGLLATDTLVKLGVRVCRRIIAVSEFAKDEIVHLTGVSEENVSVSLEAADAQFSQRSGLNVQSDLRDVLPAGLKRYFLCVANSYPHKNLETLVEAFGLMGEDCDHYLVVVGKPRRGESAFVEACQALPARIQERILRLERVTYEQLIRLYQHCDAFVFPSRYEGFGLPVLEAILAGVPVIAADIPTSHEVGGDAVRMVEPGDFGGFAEAMKSCLLEPEEKKKARLVQALEYVQGFSWQRTAEITRDCLVSASRTD